ncbi:OsmC family protein [soil metagenome]
MLKRYSTAVWKGDGPKGSGAITTTSGALKDAPYGVNARFVSEDGKAGTNPEELIAAAHASCFTMATAFQFTGAGKTPTELSTTATVSMEKQEAGWTITGIHLELKGSVPGTTPEEWKTLTENAKKGCPISKALASVPITLTATLV